MQEFKDRPPLPDDWSREHVRVLQDAAKWRTDDMDDSLSRGAAVAGLRSYSSDYVFYWGRPGHEDGRRLLQPVRALDT